jgi:uncharacterized membrane protein YagU involved in acid resistance
MRHLRIARSGIARATRGGMRARQSPMGALMRGIFAGALGSLTQGLFFMATQRIAPKPPRQAFRAPEPEQCSESETEVVARRFVERMMQRGPLEHKAAAGQVVHYAFGSLWGALYGLAAPSLRPLTTLPGGLAFGSLVWLISDGLIVPAFRLADWPQRYPVKNHAYAIAAHLVYGATVFAAYALANRRNPLRTAL